MSRLYKIKISGGSIPLMTLDNFDAVDLLSVVLGETGTELSFVREGLMTSVRLAKADVGDTRWLAEILRDETQLAAYRSFGGKPQDAEEDVIAQIVRSLLHRPCTARLDGAVGRYVREMETALGVAYPNLDQLVIEFLEQPEGLYPAGISYAPERQKAFVH